MPYLYARYMNDRSRVILTALSDPNGCSGRSVVRRPIRAQDFVLHLERCARSRANRVFREIT
jgi:hypothetical protein